MNNTEYSEIQNLDSEEIRNKIIREGVWEQFTERIKNLLKSQEELWKLYDTESYIDAKRKILEDVINLQSTINDWYAASRKFVEIQANTRADVV